MSLRARGTDTEARKWRISAKPGHRGGMYPIDDKSNRAHAVDPGGDTRDLTVTAVPVTDLRGRRPATDRCLLRVRVRLSRYVAEPLLPVRGVRSPTRARGPF